MRKEKKVHFPARTSKRVINEARKGAKTLEITLSKFLELSITEFCKAVEKAYK